MKNNQIGAFLQYISYFIYRSTLFRPMCLMSRITNPSCRKSGNQPAAICWPPSIVKMMHLLRFIISQLYWMWRVSKQISVLVKLCFSFVSDPRHQIFRIILFTPHNYTLIMTLEDWIPWSPDIKENKISQNWNLLRHPSHVIENIKTNFNILLKRISSIICVIRNQIEKQLFCLGLFLFIIIVWICHLLAFSGYKYWQIIPDCAEYKQYKHNFKIVWSFQPDGTSHS